MAAVDALLALSQDPRGVELIRLAVNNQLVSRSVTDQHGNTVLYVNRWAPGVILCTVVPANPANHPTVNVTKAQQAEAFGEEGEEPSVAVTTLTAFLAPTVWSPRAGNSSRGVGVHMLFAVDKLIQAAGGNAEIQRLIGEDNERDASHLFQPSDFPTGNVVGQPMLRALEACIESHPDNMERIACRVFSNRFGGGCICQAGGHVPQNPFKPRCKTLPWVVRATVTPAGGMPVPV